MCIYIYVYKHIYVEAIEADTSQQYLLAFLMFVGVCVCVYKHIFVD